MNKPKIIIFDYGQTLTLAESNKAAPKGKCLEITDWNELVAFLESDNIGGR